MYIETSSPRKSGDKAYLASRVFRSSRTCSMRFFYHMYGNHIGSLSVYTRPAVGGAMKSVWTKSNSQGDRWIRAVVPLSSSTDFQVVISGVAGTSFQGDIAIDDVAFTSDCFAVGK